MPRSHDRTGHYCNHFIAAFARVLPKPTTPFLDCDTTPALNREAVRKACRRADADLYVEGTSA